MNRSVKYSKTGDWKNEVLNSLAEGLKPLGFRLRKNWQTVDRNTKGGIEGGFHVNFGIDRGPQLRLTVILSAHVRHDRVEELAMGWQRDLSKALRKQTATIGRELGALAGEWTKIWEIRDESDLPPACGDMLEWIKRVGLPFLTKYSDLREVVSVMESDARWVITTHRLPIIKALLDGPESAIPYFQREYELLKRDDDPNAKDYPLFVQAMEEEFGIQIPLDT